MYVLPRKLPVIYIIGGNINHKLNSWLAELGIHDFLHMALDIRSIAPEELKMSAIQLRSELLSAQFVISIGTFADKVLTLALIEHGTLPATTTRDIKDVSKSIVKCKDYLNQRSFYYAPRSEWPGPNSS